MYDALKPIYNKLFEIIDNRFGPRTRGSQNIERDDTHIETFKHLDKGWGRLTQKNTAGTEFPYGALDWGEIGDVTFFRGPNGFTYKLKYPLIIISHEGTLRPATQTIIKTFQGNNDPKPGIGDIVARVGSYMWKAHHENRFTTAQTDTDTNTDGLTPWDWSITDWTFGVCDCNFQPATDLLTNNPLCRGTQLNFTFSVIEQKP